MKRGPIPPMQVTGFALPPDADIYDVFRDAIERMVEKRIADAVAAEREACAKLAEEHLCGDHAGLVRAIRARGAK